MTRTKPWNTKPEDLPDDLPEKPVYDYADVEKTKTCGLKFKTRPHRLLLWANAHKREYPTAKWERQTVDTVTMRTGNHNKEFGSLVVKFHTTTNVILVQGKAHENWLSNFSVLLDIVSHWELHPEELPCVPDPAQDNGLLSLSFITPCLGGIRPIMDNTLSSCSDIAGDIDLEQDSDGESSVEFSDSQVSQKDPLNADTKGESFSGQSMNEVSDNKTITPTAVAHSKSHVNTSVVACDDDLIQNNYIRVVDDSNRAIQALSTSLDQMKTDVDKIPSKIFALLTPSFELLKNEHQNNRDLIDNQILENRRLAEENVQISLRLNEEKNLHRQTRQKLAQLQIDFDKFKRENDKRLPPSPFRVPLVHGHPPGFPSGGPPLRSALNASFTTSTPRRPESEATKASQTFCAQPSAPVFNGAQPSDQITNGAQSNQNLASSPTKSSASKEATIQTDAATAKTEAKHTSTQEPAATAPPAGENSEIKDLSASSSDSSTDSSKTTTDEPDVHVSNQFTTQKGDRFAMYNIRSNAEAVLLHDSTGKYVDGNKFMGSLKAYKQKASTAEKANDILKGWKVNTKCKYAVAHTGVNDVTDGTSAHRIIKFLKQLLDLMHEKHPNAVIAFSEILYIGRGERDSNDNESITKINDAMYEFCTVRDYAYVTHSNLQSTSCKLFDDDKHIDAKGGTAVFCSDILNGTGYRKQRRNDPTATSKGRSDRRPIPTSTFTNNQLREYASNAAILPTGKGASPDTQDPLIKLMMTYCLQNMMRQ